MTKAADDLFAHHSDEPRRVGPGQLHMTGILPSHGIQTLIREKEIWGGHEIDKSQIQLRQASIFGSATRPTACAPLSCRGPTTA